MAFVRKKVSTYEWPVTAEVPVDGRFEKQSFKVIFKRLGRSQFKELAEQGDAELLDAVLEGWESVEDENGKALAFTPAIRREMTDDPFFTRAVLKAYLESLEGAQVKN